MAAAALLSLKGRRYGLILLLGLNPAFFIGSLYDRFFPVLPAGISIAILRIKDPLRSFLLAYFIRGIGYIYFCHKIF